MKKITITEQVRKEILENAPAIIAFHDTEQDIVWANKAYREATGLSFPEMEGKKCYSVWGLDKPCRNCPVQRALKTGEAAESLLSPEDQEHWPETQGSWLSKAAPIRDEQGKIIGAVETALEITERRREERAALHEAGERHLVTLMSVGDAVITTDPGGRVELMNPEAERLTGWTQDEARGKALDEVFRIINEGKRQPVESPVARILRDGKVIGLANDTLLIAKDGTERPIADSGAPIRAKNGAILGVVLVFRDQTEQRAAEKAMKRRVNELYALNTMTTGIMTASNVDELFSHTMEEVLRLVGVEVSAILLLDDKKRELALVAHRGISDEFAQNFRKMRIGEGLAGKAAQSAEPAILRNPEEYPKHLRAFLERDHIQSAVAIPLIGRRGIIGVMNLAASSPEYFDIAGIDLLLNLGRQIAIGIEQIRMTESLQETEKRFRALVEKSKDCVITLDETGKVTYASSGLARILGLTPEAFLGQIVFEYLHPEDENRIREIFRQILRKTGGSETAECRARHSSGQWRWIEGTATNLLDEPAVGSIVLNFHDITERKQIEEEIRGERERLRTILDNIPVMITMYDSKGRMLLLNKEFERLVGWGKEDAEKVDLMKEVYPDPEYRKKAWAFMISARAEWQDFKVRTRKGDIVESAWRNVRLSDGSQIGIGVDIRELRAAEQALRESKKRFDLLVNRLNDVVWSANADGSQAIDINQAFEKVYGRTVDEYRSNPNLWIEVVHTDDRKIAEASAEQLFTNGQAQAEYRIVRPDGEIRWLRDRKSLIFDDAGRPIQMGGIANDITEIKQQEKAQEKLRAQFLQAQKMEAVGRLAGGVAHDFNNMLSIIIGRAELAMMKLEPSDALYAELDEILKAGQRSTDLVGQLLAFARKQTASPRVLDLNETVAGMLDMLHRIIGEDIEVLWKPGANLWPVKIDPSQIDQILANLAVNARDAIAGVGKLTIETKKVTLDEAYCAQHAGFVPGDYAMLAVSDDGCGMDEEALNNIFEPFFTTKKPGEGTGLGLSTVYGIVKQNKGFINVYSEPGHGTTMKIYLPRFAGVAGDEKEAPEKEIPKGRGETVLLAEDDPQVVSLGKRFLEYLGYRVLTAAKPNEAVRLAREHPSRIDLLLTDVVMPEMNGRELSEQILAIQPGMKVLFMSGYTADVIAHHGVLDEGVLFVQKPLQLQNLAAKIREALEKE
ncbi:MAG: PAS domain S-box protein [Deltaproteobacteria bacterium]|nr:PAS domain S-box protein [Deltaproteobacteria bacterium]